MNKHPINWLLSILLLTVTSQSLASGFQPSVSVGNQQLQLCNQAPIKALAFISVGEAALYLLDCDKAEQKLQQPIQLSIIYQRAFSADDFIESATKLLQRNVSETEFEQLREELDRFNSNYQAISKGERYDIGYSPSAGLRLQKNGQEISRSASNALGSAYFKIWFGDKPFNKKLKKRLLAP